MCFTFFTNTNAQVLSPEAEFSIHIEQGELIVVNGINYWLLPIELKNNSTDKIQYRTWSCAWEDFYSVNKIEVQIVQEGCDKNYPTTETLEPQELKKKILKLKISPGTKKKLKIKIGMDYIKMEKVENLDDARLGDLPDSGQMFWSNEISIQVK